MIFIDQKRKQKRIEKRLKEKKMAGEKINVVFICHRPSVWSSLNSVYDALKNDDNFKVSIVAIPNKKEIPFRGLHHEIYESEGAEEYWSEYGCINGYNYKTKKWFDLRELKPDYVFFQQPYNITRCRKYKSFIVSKYAKICYVAYAADFIGNGVLEETSPIDFMRNVYAYFTQNNIDDALVKKMFFEEKNYYTHVVMTGFPRYDLLENFIGCESTVWSYPRGSNHFRVLWTPRWCTNEGNCSFFDYKDIFLDFFEKHKEYDFVFRPHPQAFLNWNRTGELSKADSEQYIERYIKSDNMNIDKNKEYFKTIFSSDCLISDASSFVADYFLSEKPIIYCHKVNTFNELSSKMSEGFYWVNNWKELLDILEMLRSGIDPLKEKRQKICLELGLSIENKQNAGNKIKDFILSDARK